MLLDSKIKDEFLKNHRKKKEAIRLITEKPEVCVDKLIKRAPTLTKVYIETYKEFNSKYNSENISSLFLLKMHYMPNLIRNNNTDMDIIFINNVFKIYNYDMNVDKYYNEIKYHNETIKNITKNIKEELLLLRDIFTGSNIEFYAQSYQISFSFLFTYKVWLFLLENYDKYEEELNKSVKQKIFEYRLKR